MNCLIDYVGLRGCNQSNPESGLYINDYPAMCTELLEKISAPEQSSYAGFWESIQKSSYVRFRRDIQSNLYFTANAKLEQVLFQTSKIFVNDWQQVQILDEAPEYRGVFVSIEGTKYYGLKIRQLYVYNAGDALVSVPIKIFQSQDGKVLWSNDNVPLEVGMNYVDVNDTFYSDFDKLNIFIAVDCTELKTLQGPFVDWGWEAYEFDCATQLSYLYRDGWTLFPVKAPLDYGLGIKWNQNTTQNGIYMDAALICSIDSFICHQREWLLDSWANLLCYNILFAKMGSNRANYFAQGNREFTSEAMSTYLDNYNESLKVWARQLNLKNEGLCFNCEDAQLIKQGFTKP